MGELIMSKNAKKKDNKKKDKDKGKNTTPTLEGSIPSELFSPMHGQHLFDYDPKRGLLTINQLASTNFANVPLAGFEIEKDSPFIFHESMALPTSTTLNQQIDLQGEITNLRKELGNTIEELAEVKEDKEKKEARIRKLERKQKELLKKENLMHLIGRVNEKARERLFESEDFANLFDINDIRKVVIMSIDIRRSTELMLKAREPKLYAEFITSLCEELTNIITSNFGVFDKFTGDGILAFFPDFYSGSNATFYALKSAEECHKSFNGHYEEHRRCFSTVLKEVGLGIGIDFGEAYLTNVNGDLTVVGNPVVYACRFSGAEHGETLLNQPAYEEAKSKYHDHCQFSETEIKIKHEGEAVAYRLNSINYEEIKIDPPDWDELTQQYKKE